MHGYTVMPGYTHLQRAQPVTFGHHADGVRRDAAPVPFGPSYRTPPSRHGAARCRPGFRGALAGTTYPLDRSVHGGACLGFASHPRNSHRRRVRICDFCDGAVLAPCAPHRRTCRACARRSSCGAAWEFKLVIALDDAFSTGGRPSCGRRKTPTSPKLMRGKIGPRVRRFDHAADHDEGPAAWPMTRVCRRTRRPFSTRWTRVELCPARRHADAGRP